jgi:hypothetical protein
MAFPESVLQNALPENGDMPLVDPEQNIHNNMSMLPVSYAEHGLHQYVGVISEPTEQHGLSNYAFNPQQTTCFADSFGAGTDSTGQDFDLEQQ